MKEHLSVNQSFTIGTGDGAMRRSWPIDLRVAGSKPLGVIGFSLNVNFDDLLSIVKKYLSRESDLVPRSCIKPLCADRRVASLLRFPAVDGSTIKKSKRCLVC